MTIDELKGAAAVTEIRPCEFTCIFTRERIAAMIDVIQAGADFVDDASLYSFDKRTRFIDAIEKLEAIK